MFGKSAEDKAAEKQAKQEAKDKEAMEKFGLVVVKHFCNTCG